MIKAEHKKWARILYDFYITRLLKKNFNRFLLTNNFPQVDSRSTLIITPNHFSWWDGFFVDYYTGKFLDRKIFLLMLEEQLKRFWFFSKVGAYSINPDNPKSIWETLTYSSNILSNTRNFVVFYPQGRIEPYDKRPPDLKPGLVKLIESIKSKTEIVPLAFKIIYSNNKKPDVIVRAGEKLIIDNGIIEFEMFSSAFLKTLNELDEYSLTGDEKDIFKK